MKKITLTIELSKREMWMCHIKEFDIWAQGKTSVGAVSNAILTIPKKVKGYKWLEKFTVEGLKRIKTG